MNKKLRAVGMIIPVAAAAMVATNASRLGQDRRCAGERPVLDGVALDDEGQARQRADGARA